jgi:predicted CXXCH cytochrome family protein
MVNANSDSSEATGSISRLRWTSWMVTVVPCAVLVVLLLCFSVFNQTIYDAGPLSAAHARMRNDCGLCHQWPDGPARFDKHSGLVNVGPVPDTACWECHAAPAHQVTQIAEKVYRCAECHREHRGDQQSLARVADSFCTSCHADLLTTSGPSHDFVRQITSFANHPQFAVLRGGPSESQIAGEDLGPGEGHRVYEVAERVASSLPWTWRDKANLRFNHQSHLHPDGVLVPPSHAEYGDGKTFKRLECSDCHVPDDDGRYMRPINYESHCMACHSLDFSTKLHQIDASLDLTGPLPHVEPQLIRGLLRDRLMAYARKHPDVVRGEPIPEAPRMICCSTHWPSSTRLTCRLGGTAFH